MGSLEPLKDFAIETFLMAQGNDVLRCLMMPYDVQLYQRSYRDPCFRKGVDIFT